MSEGKKKKKRKREEFTYKDFRVIFDFPERLSQYLREWLHLTKLDWDFCIDKIRQGKPYLEWRKSKGKGRGFRYFAAPCEELKLVQRAILNRILSQIPAHFARHGNQIGSSIISNAEHHRGFAKAVYSVDIINAFPTVFRSRVKANLRKPFEFGLRQFSGVVFSDADKDMMLDVLCDLMCLRDRLPQGPPTSPRILDLVCMKMDQEIYNLLQKNSTPFQSYRFTAWSDDLTISSNGEIPEELRKEILDVVRKNGFIPHVRKDKTKYYSPETGEMPIVTGLVLNPERLTVAPNKVNQLRARLHKFLKLQGWDKTILGQINGTLGFIRQVYPKNLPSKIRDCVEKIERRLAETKALAISKKIEQLEYEIEALKPGEKSEKKKSAKKEKKPSKTIKKVEENSHSPAMSVVP